MKKEEADRNRPADKGRDNDPGVRDESAIQPGVSTVSSSDSDRANEQLTKTAAGDFTENAKDPRADPVYDEVDNEDE